MFQVAMWRVTDSTTMLEKRFGRYVIEAELGRGGMGVVYRARDIRLDRHVAIKVLNRRLQLHPNAWGWIIREARNASALNHPCICTVYDAGEEKGQPYVAMEYVEGRPLSAMLTPYGLPPPLVMHYGRLLSSALAHAHERGIIHRDIKSANVMVTAQGELKVLDFGLAKRLQVHRSHGAPLSSPLEIGRVVGTVAYLAPEVLRGERATVSSDIWSLGILLFEIATGHLPFQGRTTFELAAAVMASDPVWAPRAIPDQIARVIGCCLEKKACDRYQRARDIMCDLPAKGLPDLETCWRLFNMSLSRAASAGSGGTSR
jgi:serine/threonine protein kinase